MSNSPVREAIGLLQSEGLVVHIAHRGAFVKGLDRQELVDLFEVRTALECHAATGAARRITEALLQELDHCWLALCRSAQAFSVPPGSDLREALKQWLLADLAFHMLLLRAARNRRLMQMIQDTRMMAEMFSHRTDTPAAWADPAAFAAENLRIHRAVYEAIRRRDPKAARRAMAAHMRRARFNALTRFDWLRREERLAQSVTEEYPDSMRELVEDIERRSLAAPPAAPDHPAKTQRTTRPINLIENPNPVPKRC